MLGQHIDSSVMRGVSVPKQRATLGRSFYFQYLYLWDLNIRLWPVRCLFASRPILLTHLGPKMYLEPLEKMYRVNVFSPMMLTKFVLRNMLYNKISGSIIHISSISVHTGYKGLSMYASSKGALEAFSKNTAREWGQRGIRSNALVAGFMETDMSGTLSDDQRNRIFNRTSLKKPTSKESVAAMVEFLLNDKANSVTGQNIFVDNGTI